MIAVKKARLTHDSPVPFRAPVSGQYFCEPTYPLLLHMWIVPHDLIIFLHTAVVAVKTAQLSQVSQIPAREPVSGQYPHGTARDLTLLCLLIVPCNLFHFLPVAVVAVKKMAQLPKVSLIPAREPVLGQYLSVTTRDPILLNLSTVPLDLTPLPSHFSGRSQDGPTSTGQPDSCSRARIR